MPAKKDEYETVFNELLGTNIKWAKLNLEDLIQLAVLFDNPELFLKKLGVTEQVQKDDARKRVGHLVLEIAEGWEGPVVKALKKLVGS